MGLEDEIELDSALEALLDDADALLEQATAARWRTTNDVAFFGFGSLNQVLFSENRLVSRNVCGSGVLLKSHN
eukprot:SAG31_NODE_5166_length_2704_cov_2.110940_5_plen_73_part_00